MKSKLLSQKDGINKYKTNIFGKDIVISISENGELIDVSTALSKIEQSSIHLNNKTIEFG